MICCCMSLVVFVVIAFILNYAKIMGSFEKSSTKNKNQSSNDNASTLQFEDAEYRESADDSNEDS